jgi:glucose/arabinose dehydrogenase
MKKWPKILISLITLIFVYLAATQVSFNKEPDQTENQESNTTQTQQAPEIVLENLNIPWEVAFLPDKSILITERGGNLLKIGEERLAIPVSGVSHSGEDGLLGMVLDPQFTVNQNIYLYLTTQINGKIENRVERYKLVENNLSERIVIISGIPGSNNHDGGRIAFGPDGYLYITTGDAGDDDSAQDLSKLSGKILRINKDGLVPMDNPFDNEIYSYGHRNPQGLAWDNLGNLWATEHGRSGVQSGFDEVNLIVKGGNYGWPEIEGTQRREGMISPVAQSGESKTWAPSGMVYSNGRLLFAGLRGEAVYSLKIENGKVIGEVTEHIAHQFGRIRTIVLGPDNLFYIITSNTDGRGNKKEGDDKLVKLSL